ERREAVIGLRGGGDATLQVGHAIRASHDHRTALNHDHARAWHGRSAVCREEVIDGHARFPSATGGTGGAEDEDQDFAPAYHAFHVSAAAPPPMVSCC